MIKNDKIIKELMYGDAVHILAAERSIGLTEARLLLSQMSFSEYRNMVEAGSSIVPPSGQTIGPSSTQPPQGTSSPQKMKAIWPGKGAPVEMGMTVGLKGPSGLPVPGQVSQVDAAAKGVKVKNPTTGQDEWMNIDQLQPYMAGGQQGQNTQPNAGAEYKPITTVEDATQLTRLRELAGIREDASCGATGAGAIAVVPTAIGKLKRRQPTEEQLKKEYTPKGAPKTIIGDTKPNQASGELSANLAASGKKSAGRTNNGFKR
jgi:hypothetical protein